MVSLTRSIVPKIVVAHDFAAARVVMDLGGVLKHTHILRASPLTLRAARQKRMRILIDLASPIAAGSLPAVSLKRFRSAPTRS